MARTPPYANGARIVAGTLWIRFGRRGWQFLKAHPECGELVCPGDTHPAEFDWAARGLECYIVADESDNKDDIARLSDCLYAQGASQVHAIYQIATVPLCITYPVSATDHG